MTDDIPLKACIFNIQKFSLHDGPGIRTTVFFKGCPLRCAWCANPESLRPGVEVLWDARKCVSCGVCAGVCPEKAIAVTEDGATVDRERCVGCGECARGCPQEALSVSGREYSLDEVVAACLADKDFYDESGGGVTLSGGEVTAQHRFAGALVDRLHREGVRVALETNGFAPEAIFQELGGKADLLLMDVKHYDEARHRRGTGAGLEKILANMRWAVGAGKDVLPRIPVIPHYNASLRDARGFAELLVGLGLTRVQLLPFHQLGEGKYDMLALPYQFRGERTMEKTDLSEYKKAMEAYGLEVIV